MIRLQSSVFTRLELGDPVVAAREALALAVKLEHATIPPYLYAYYSLDQSKNGLIADLILSIVMEEMLHMGLACNLLNALGGRPSLASAASVPTYPGPLPGGVEGDLRVGLAPFSMAQLDIFLKIEEPEHPLEFRLAAASGDGALKPTTIGQFYGGILARIEEAAANGAPFSGLASRQVDASFIDGLIPVTTLADARAAIATIVEQGEGTTQRPTEAVDSQEFAHYYRFLEIKKGRALVRTPGAKPTDPPEKQFSFGGAKIDFDPSGVLPAPVDPRAANFALGTAERLALDAFNSNYMSMLSALDQTFNGRPTSSARAASLMRDLGRQAVCLMDGSAVTGVHLGPSFESSAGNGAAA